jgi:hypothetical protein
MRVEIDPEFEEADEETKTEGQTDFVPATTTRPPRRESIQIEYATGTDKWHMEDTPGVYMYEGIDITIAEAMPKSGEDLTRGIYRSADTIAPVLVEDANARGHRMPNRLDQNRAWTRWNNSLRQSDYNFCQVCQNRRPDTLINVDACHTVCDYYRQEHDNREVHTGSCVGECFYCKSLYLTSGKFGNFRDFFIEIFN